jgi:Raf kinase inhibitor-like YbhB/YbcL family protein
MDFQTNELKITSPAFQNEGEIPSKYTCDGEGVNPPLHIENIPEGTNTLALIVEDPDAPNRVFDHWLAWNIKPASNINEDSLPGTSGDNSAGRSGYHPPCPPNGSHRYYSYFFALDIALDILAGANKELLLEVMEGHVIAKGSLIGRYERKK